LPRCGGSFARLASIPRCSCCQSSSTRGSTTRRPSRHFPDTHVFRSARWATSRPARPTPGSALSCSSAYPSRRTSAGPPPAIRSALDSSSHEDTAILAYAAKYASSLYGPFRDAADCAPAFGDRKAYQLDPPNRREALAELAADVAEGADALMVKPAGPYLDVIAAARARFDLPIAAYQVSGEYSALHAAAQRGWLDLRRAALESLTAI